MKAWCVWGTCGEKWGLARAVMSDPVSGMT